MKAVRRALIIDDEAPARKGLRELLAARTDVEVVGEAASAIEAIAEFHRVRPDLIFLDVQMPRRDGFSILSELQPAPDIIFVTAYDCFAVKAFEVNAVDYLVKPIPPERLTLALARLAKPAKRKAKPFASDDHVILHSNREVRVVLATEITHIEAEHNYTHVHTVNRKPMLVRRRMSEWERLLPPEIFVRPDRSVIVNRRAVKELVPQPRDHARVAFFDQTAEVELGRGASRRLRRMLLELG
jgi:two-component system LytT family response regulator